jgi:cytochrome c peroxidase
VEVSASTRRAGLATAACAALWLAAACSSDDAPADAGGDAAVLDAGSDAAAPSRDAATDAARPDASGDAATDAAVTSPDAASPATPDAAASLPAYPGYPPVPFPDDNPFSADKALLGKALFWEEQLSADDSVACGTCHRPAAGGADPRPAQAGFVGHPGADGVRGTDDDPRGSPGIRRCSDDGDADGGVAPVDDALFGGEVQVTRRRAMSALDAMFYPELFWDGRAPDAFVDPEAPASVLLATHGALESQAVQPLQSDVEMACEGFTWSGLADKLARVAPLAVARALTPDLATALAGGADYPALFDAAFGTPDITPVRIAFAIATYERTLTSDETPWDRFNRGEADALTAAQERGALSFFTRAGCACCHGAPLFGGVGYVNDAFSDSVWDEGRFEVTAYEPDRARFRVPGLRNVGLREAAGLLHDGVGAGQDLDTLLARYNEPPRFPTQVGLCVRHAAGLSAEGLSDLADFVRDGLTDPRAAAETPPFDRPRLGSEPP